MTVSSSPSSTQDTPVVPGPRLVTTPAPERSPCTRPGAGAPLGEWTWHPGSGAWVYSPALLALLALTPAVSPEVRGGRRGALAGLRLPHVHAEDRLRLRTALEGAALQGRPFAVDVRFLCGDGRVADTTVTGAPATGDQDPGAAHVVRGLVVDVTADRTRTGQADDDPQAALRREVEQLRAAMASRALIEQAKGVLMALVTCSDHAAFDLLGHLSNHTHRKVREVAALVVGSASGADQLPADLQEILRDACPPVVPGPR